jgi:type II secretion system protein C
VQAALLFSIVMTAKSILPRMPLMNYRTFWPAGIQTAPRILEGVFALLLLAEVLHVVGELRRDQRASNEVHFAVPHPSAPLDLAQIMRAHLFGSETESQDLADAPNARGALVLAGVLASPDPGNGFAILAAPEQPMRLYHTGVSLVGLNGRLFQVYADRVIVELNGRLEVLRFLREGGAPHAIAAVARANGGAPHELASDPRPAEVPRAASAIGGLDGEFSSSSGGRGMLLHPEKRMQRRYGLQEGDILTEINGAAVSNAEALNKALDSATQALSLTVVHAGVARTVTVPIQ